MRPTRVVVLTALILTSCSSGTTPVSDKVVAQLNEGKRAAVEAGLRNLAAAQEAYFVETGSYSNELTALSFIPEDEVVVTIVRADMEGFCAEAAHIDALDVTLHLENGADGAVDGPCPDA